MKMQRVKNVLADWFELPDREKVTPTTLTDQIYYLEKNSRELFSISLLAMNKDFFSRTVK